MIRTMAAVSGELGLTDDWQGDRNLAECNLHMLKSADTFDVTFRVGKNEDIVHAHRYVLVSRSCVFHSMLCGKWSEGEPIKMPDVSKKFFKEFLSFLYTDDCSFTADNVTGLLYLSKKYAVHRLHRLCLSFLQTNLTPENARVVLEQSHIFDEDELFQKALTIITTNGSISLTTAGFRDLCHRCLNKVLISNDLDLHTQPELVFDRVLSWASTECSRQDKEINPRNQRDVLGDSVYLIGLTGFDAKDFVQKVVPSQLLDDNECLKVLSNVICPNNDVGRFRVVDTENRSKGKLQGIEVYNESCIPTDNEIVLFERKNVHDALNIKCTQTSLLHGIILAPSEARYTVSVTQADISILTTTFNATFANARLDFPTSVRLEPHLTYRVHVEHKDGKCPLVLLKNMKVNVCVQNKRFHLSRNSKFKNENGMIIKLCLN